MGYRKELELLLTQSITQAFVVLITIIIMFNSNCFAPGIINGELDNHTNMVTLAL